MTRWLPRTHVRGFEKLGANAKIDLRPFLSLSLGSLPRDRCGRQLHAVHSAQALLLALRISLSCAEKPGPAAAMVPG